MTRFIRNLYRTCGAYDGMISGRVNAVAGSAIPLVSSTTPILEVQVQNSPGSTSNILIGSINRQDTEIIPGASQVIPINDLFKVRVRGDGGAARVNFLAMT